MRLQRIYGVCVVCARLRSLVCFLVYVFFSGLSQVNRASDQVFIVIIVILCHLIVNRVPFKAHFSGI